MATLGKEYVQLDGMFLREDQIIKLALGAGNFSQAEHYLFALAVHAAIFGMPELIEKVNDVREAYGVPVISMPNQDVSGGFSRLGDTADDKARRVFLLMDDEERRNVLKESLQSLRSQYHLFKYANHWLGVYLVIRDRLEGENLTMKAFIGYANDIMPEDWPASLRMTLSTYKNMSKMISIEDRDEAYYDMEKNPQQDLCKTFWEVVKLSIFTT